MRRRRPSRWRVLLGTAAAASTCFLALFLTAVGVVAVQGWMKSPPPVGADPIPAVGEPAPDFVLKDLDGKDCRLADELAKKPVVVEFGSATCPYCVQAAPGMDEIARKYKDSIDFVFIYCKEAHPDTAGMILPGTQETLPALPQTSAGEERSGRARSYCSAKQPAARVLVDVDGPESVQTLYGGQPNQVVVIDTHGRIDLELTLGQLPGGLDAFLREHFLQGAKSSTGRGAGARIRARMVAGKSRRPSMRTTPRGVHGSKCRPPLQFIHKVWCNRVAASPRRRRTSRRSSPLRGWAASSPGRSGRPA